MTSIRARLKKTAKHTDAKNILVQKFNLKKSHSFATRLTRIKDKIYIFPVLSHYLFKISK